jgi:hypothetical protein
MERAIGDLKVDLRLDSNPNANLAHIAKWACQTNVMRAWIPGLGRKKKTPAELGYELKNAKGYVSLHPQEARRRPVSAAEKVAIQKYITAHRLQPNQLWQQKSSVLRWGRLSLPSGGIARTAWREELKIAANLRTAQMVEVSATLPHL